MTLHTGDCLDVMPRLAAGSVDAVVTDPPYGLGEPRSGSDEVSGRCFAPRSAEAKARRSGGFMGKAWDGTGIAFDPATWEAVGRVARPGAYLLAFGGTRTVHRMTCAIEDAGWVIRDVLVWAYAQGFPKSRASLKPAWEPIVMARKPGLAAPLQIDRARIGFASAGDEAEAKGKNQHTRYANPASNRDSYSGNMPERTDYAAAGRWPANVLLTDPIFDGDADGVVGGGQTGPSAGGGMRNGDKYGGGFAPPGVRDVGLGDTGTYSRFFLVPKSARAEREPLLSDLPERVVSVWGGDEDDLTPGKKSTIARRNTHPTVKPLDLMRHLVRLVTPPGGTVLDPFGGSGTTAIACEMEGFPWVMIEREPEYVAIAEARLLGTQRGMGLSLPVPRSRA